VRSLLHLFIWVTLMGAVILYVDWIDQQRPGALAHVLQVLLRAVDLR